LGVVDVSELAKSFYELLENAPRLPVGTIPVEYGLEDEGEEEDSEESSEWTGKMDYEKMKGVPGFIKDSTRFPPLVFEWLCGLIEPSYIEHMKGRGRKTKVPFRTQMMLTLMSLAIPCTRNGLGYQLG
jgi:hypothetical protein